MASFIYVRGAREHNLKNIDIAIPKNELVGFTGVSGSGKSSLVFDTVYAEAFRRFSDASQAPVYLMGNSSWGKISRPKFSSISGLPPALGLSQRQGVAGKLSTVGTVSGISDLFRVYFAAFGDIFCRKCDIPLRATPFAELMAQLMRQLIDKKITVVATIAEKRKGGFAKEIEKFRQLGFSKLQVNEEIFDLQDEALRIKIDVKKLNTISILIDSFVLNEERKSRLQRAVLQALEYGKGFLKIETQHEVLKFNNSSSCPQCEQSAPKLDPRYFSHSSLGQCTKCLGEGSAQEGMPSDLFPCTECQGTRLTFSGPIVRVGGVTFEHLHQLSLEELCQFVLGDLADIVQGDKSKLKIFSEIQRLLYSIKKMSVDHLTLNRSANSLSPGDLQRLRLASMISNTLKGALYALDEPCQGLTKEEVQSLVKELRHLVTRGSSVVAVEHHPTFLRSCDVLVSMGPGAGVHGGHILAIAAQGKSNAKGGERKGETEHPPVARGVKKGDAALCYSQIFVRNLKAPEIKLYQNKINMLRGHSGLGKSSFVELCFLPSLLHRSEAKKRLIEDYPEIPYRNFCHFVSGEGVKVTSLDYIKPGALTRSSKRAVASALDVLVPLRELFAQLPQSQVLGLEESHFSWNSKLGRCSYCEGRGYLEIPQKYAQPLRVPCETCLGSKLGSKSLLPRFKGNNFAEVMNLTLDQALNLFENQKNIATKIQKACQFGLGYVQLGQGLDSLSGGELQRLTLTMELKRSHLEGAWFVLIHPGTGLHAPDIEVLGKLMQVMVSRGATFVMIENREEFLKFSDHLIDFESFA